MRMQFYTNTGKASSVIGAIVISAACSAASIVGVAVGVTLYEKAVEVIKTNAIQDKIGEMLHKGKKQYVVCERTYDGQIRDTGKRIWR